MKTTLLLGLALVASLMVVPGAAADGGDDGAILCKFLANTAFDLPERLVGDTKQFVEDLKDQPCTCDPMPDPGP